MTGVRFVRPRDRRAVIPSSPPRARDLQPERPTVPGVVRVRDKILALPKGHPEQAANRPRRPPSARCARTGLEATPVEKPGRPFPTSLLVPRDGDRVLKVVSFFLFRYRSGRLEDHDDEVEDALWIPLEEAPARLAYRGEKDMARTALSQLAKGS